MKNIWQSGEWVDLWSVPHFLFGVIVGFLPLLFRVAFEPALLLLIIVALLWEAFELVRGYFEYKSNSFMDVALSVVGFLGVYFLIIPYLAMEVAVPVLIIIFATYLLLNYLGWRAYHRRKGWK